MALAEEFKCIEVMEKFVRNIIILLVFVRCVRRPDKLGSSTAIGTRGSILEGKLKTGNCMGYNHRYLSL